MFDKATAELPITYLITNGNLTTENYLTESIQTLQKISRAIDLKTNLIQIREKNLPAKYVLDLAKKAVDISTETDTKILVNDRFDVAVAARADGVHLTSNSIPTDIVRRHLPDKTIIGVSTHSTKAAENARLAGADFVTYSPIFQTTSKTNYGEPKGLNNLKNICEKLKPFPVLALGGITPENYESALQSGAAGFAGISFFDAEKSIKINK